MKYFPYWWLLFFIACDYEPSVIKEDLSELVSEPTGEAANWWRIVSAFYLSYHYTLDFFSRRDPEYYFIGVGSLLEGRTSMRYYLEDGKFELMPDWTSLEGLNKTQFTSLIGGQSIEGFDHLWKQWIDQYGNYYPRTVELIHKAFLRTS